MRGTLSLSGEQWMEPSELFQDQPNDCFLSVPSWRELNSKTHNLLNSGILFWETISPHWLKKKGRRTSHTDVSHSVFNSMHKVCFLNFTLVEGSIRTENEFLLEEFEMKYAINPSTDFIRLHRLKESLLCGNRAVKSEISFLRQGHSGGFLPHTECF